MKNIIVFLFELFIQMTAARTKSNIYSIIINERAMLDAMKATDARSSMDCAAHCTLTDGCRRAQWRNGGCELLTDAALGEPIELGYEDKAIYMYQQSCDVTSCDVTSCEHGVTCVANSTGTFCACPDGYGGSPCGIECDATLDNHCFMVYPGWHTWYEAKELCETDGGRLPEVCSAETQYILEQILNDHDLTHMWLGGRDEAVETQWEWVTRSCDFSSFENWRYTPSEDAIENCMYMTQGYWYDYPCTPWQWRVICEFY